MASGEYFRTKIENKKRNAFEFANQGFFMRLNITLKLLNYTWINLIVYDIVYKIFAL